MEKNSKKDYWGTSLGYVLKYIEEEASNVRKNIIASFIVYYVKEINNSRNKSQVQALRT